MLRFVVLCWQPCRWRVAPGRIRSARPPRRRPRPGQSSARPRHLQRRPCWALGFCLLPQRTGPRPHHRAGAQPMRQPLRRQPRPQRRRADASARPSAPRNSAPRRAWRRPLPRARWPCGENSTVNSSTSRVHRCRCKWVDPEVASRYGVAIYVRCGPQTAGRRTRRPTPHHRPRFARPPAAPR